MSAPPPPEQFWLQTGTDPAFATVHRPASGTASATAVLICPPFGWEEICSYRPLRRWAEALATAGHETLRLSYPSTGDSGGSPTDPDRLGAWVASIADAVAWLRANANADANAESAAGGGPGAARVAIVGLGLGGMLACLAAAAGAAVDDLILWGTPARGRGLVRSLRAFAALELAECYQGLGEPPSDATRPGDIEAGGFLLSAETVAALESVDLGTLVLPKLPGARRALLLDRDGIAPDAPLREALERSGCMVTVAPGDGFADATSHPQESVAPIAVIERVGGWLDEAEPEAVAAPAPQTPIAGADRGHAGAIGSPAGADGGPAAAPSILSVELQADGGRTIRETTITIDRPSGRLAGILSEPLQPPEHGLCAVMLNAGAVRRIGPGRMWVEAARRWAAQGVPTLRFDSAAIGDSDGDERPYRDDGALYAPSFVPDVLAALDLLQDRAGGRRFVLGGLCSGANWSFHASLRDDRVRSVLLINPRALVYTDELGPGRDLRALLTQRPSLSKIRRLATGPRLRAFLRWLAATPIRALARLRGREPTSAGAERELDVALDAYLDSGRQMMLLFSEHEPLFDELVRSGRQERLAGAPNVTLEHVRIRDHTLRPLWSQAATHAALDRALARAAGPELRL